MLPLSKTPIRCPDRSADSGSHRESRRLTLRTVVAWVLVLPFCAALIGGGTASTASASPSGRQLLVDVSRDGSSTSSGEPTIAVNPANPGNLFTAYGTFPKAGVLNAPPPNSSCNGMISADGGVTWHAPPAHSPDVTPYSLLPSSLWPASPSLDSGCQDGVAAYGPDGTLYVGGDLDYLMTASCGTPGSFPLSPGGPCFTNPGYDPIFRSTDGGRTWSKPVMAMGSSSVAPFPFAPGSGNPLNALDRPWPAVDQSTGVVYLSAANLSAVDINNHEQFITASMNKAQSFGAIYAVDSPAYPEALSTRGSNIDAAHGVVAVAYTASPAPGGCAVTCLIFETSTDFGAIWTRHVVPLQNAASQVSPVLAADPVARGHFALTVFDSTGTENQVYTTGDFGQTWQGPTDVAEPGTHQKFKPWLSYGPSGQLALMWRSWQGTPGTSPYNVWAAVGLDLGRHAAVFSAPVSVSPAVGPYAPGAEDDDRSSVVATGRYVYVGWGNSLSLPTAGGQQVWVSRVPYSSFLTRAFPVIGLR